MSKPIRSYNDLLLERQRLESLLQAQKQVIYYDVQEIKEKLKPIKNTVEFIDKIVTKDKTSLLLNFGSDLVISSIVQKFILSKTGWLTRTIIPFFLKNYSSHFIGEQKDKWVAKLKSWLGHSNGKEQETEKENS